MEAIPSVSIFFFFENKNSFRCTNKFGYLCRICRWFCDFLLMSALCSSLITRWTMRSLNGKNSMSKSLEFKHSRNKIANYFSFNLTILFFFSFFFGFSHFLLFLLHAFHTLYWGPILLVRFIRILWAECHSGEAKRREGKRKKQSVIE